jgi:5-amino-6-(5-phosphoribosylamino)uracil reductase
MKIILSAAVSVDGHIDNGRKGRLVLSHEDDLQAVYDMRDSSDAILVGANTIRRDDPSLATKTEERRQARVARGLAAEPVKVTITRSGLLPPQARFFQDGNGLKLVYALPSAAVALRENLKGLAEVAVLPGGALSITKVADDLAARGIRTLLVEGGTDILTQFLAEGLANELRLAVAPLFVGDMAAPRFVNPAAFPHTNDRRMILRNVHTKGDTAILHYELERKT